MWALEDDLLLQKHLNVEPRKVGYCIFILDLLNMVNFASSLDLLMANNLDWYILQIAYYLFQTKLVILSDKFRH